MEIICYILMQIQIKYLIWNYIMDGKINYGRAVYKNLIILDNHYITIYN
jgi:hypothetical protein